MTGPTLYPKADRHAQWIGSRFGGVTMAMTRPKLVLHTTETAGGWPGYQDGAVAPTLTYDPWTHRWRQHFPINHSARALLDPSSTVVRENRADVVQVEVSCYCDPAHAGSGKGIKDLDAKAYQDLAEFVVWLHEEWSLPLRALASFKAYPSSAGAGNGVRLSSDAYAQGSGVLGHQHVPGNLHGDPGDFDVARILDLAEAALPSTRGHHVDAALATLGKAAKANKGNPQRLSAINQARAALRAIEPTRGA